MSRRLLLLFGLTMGGICTPVVRGQQPASATLELRIPFRTQINSGVLAWARQLSSGRSDDPPNAALPRFERGDCLVDGDWARGIQRDCGWLLVPESRNRPSSNVLRLAVEVLRAKEPNGMPPLVFLHGGPGGRGGIRVFSAGVASSPLPLHRDVVIYDQRGAGLSQPKLCPTYDRAVESTANLPEGAEKLHAVDAARRACAADLTAKRIDPSAYDTEASAADLIDLRRALGFAAWDIYGGSYGARLAQKAMALDASAIRAVVLASPTGLAISSHAEQPQSTQRAFEHVFAACEREPSCHRAFPNVAQDFYAAYDELNNSPLRVPTTLEGTVVFDGHRLVAGIRNRMGRRAEISRLPLLLHELRGGDRLRAARELVGDGSMPLSFLDAAGEIINCNDGESFGPAYRKAVDSANARARAPFRRAADREERECKDWAPGLAAPPIRAALRSDIPTLLVTGYFDDRTPTEHARRIAATLGRAYLAELPDEGHDPPRPGGCHAEIVQRFWDDPTHSPDTSCVARTPSIQFATSWDAASETRR